MWHIRHRSLDELPYAVVDTSDDTVIGCYRPGQVRRPARAFPNCHWAAWSGASPTARCSESGSGPR
jgi:hypothetical protein